MGTNEVRGGWNIKEPEGRGQHRRYERDMMRGRIIDGHPFEVEQIRFKEGQVLRNKIVFFCGLFLMVEGDDEEEPPSMYNLGTISELWHVKEVRRASRRDEW